MEAKPTWLWVVLAGGALIACDNAAVVNTGGAGATGGDSQTTTTGGQGGAVVTGGAGGTGGTVGTGGSTNYDKSECDTAADCAGGDCITVNGGYRICQVLPTEATSCQGSPFDQCCDSTECPVGEKCYAAPLVPLCGGAPTDPHNQCGADQCQTDADCANGICMPPGTVGNAVATCVGAQCGGTVCGQESLSSCALVREPCCGGPLGFVCIDETTGCQFNSDCNNGYCNQGVCSPGGPDCPP